MDRLPSEPAPQPTQPAPHPLPMAPTPTPSDPDPLPPDPVPTSAACFGARTAPKLLARLANPPRALAVKGNNIAVISRNDATGRDGAVTLIDLGTLQQYVVPSSGVLTQTLSLSNDFVYWSEGSGSNGTQVRRFALTEVQAPDTVWQGSFTFAAMLALGDEFFYAADSNVYQLADSALDSNALLEDVSPSQLVGDGTDRSDLYGSNCDQIWRLPQRGGSPQLVTETSCVSALATDGFDLFFSTTTPLPATTLNRVSASGGPVTTIGNVQDSGYAMQLDPQSVYFVTAKGLNQLDRTSSKVRLLVPGTSLRDVALDEHCVYWADARAKAVFTLEK